jgi:hypothetical protein
VLYRATRALRAKFVGVNLQWPECVAAVATAQPAVFAFRSKTSADTGAPCCRSDPAAYATLEALALIVGELHAPFTHRSNAFADRAAKLRSMPHAHEPGEYRPKVRWL